MGNRLPTTARFVAIGCTHSPLQDEDAVQWAESVIADVKPHFLVHLGDIHEANSASRWPDAKEVKYTLEDEIVEANCTLERLRRAAPKDCRCFYVAGNHDDNLLAIGRIDARIRGLVDWRRKQYAEDGEWLNEELHTHWESKAPYEYSSRGCFQVGQVTFSHGFDCGVSSDESQALTLGMPYGLFISAHTHRPVAVTQAHRTKRIPLPYWYANVGCLRDLKPDYAKRWNTALWGHAAVVGEVNTTCPSASSKRIAGSREWSAETRFRLVGHPSSTSPKTL